MPTLARGTGVNAPSLAVTLNDPGPHQFHGRAATNLTAGDLVYLADVGGTPTLTLASGAAASAAALGVGLILRNSPAGEKATAYHGVEVKYAATGLTAGTRVYASATAGALDDAATTGGTEPVGVVTNATNVYIFSPTR